MKKFLQFSLLFTALLSFSGCKVFFPGVMFKQKDYQYFELAQKKVDEYVIQPGDQLTIRLFARDGFQLIDIVDNQQSAYNPATNGTAEETYLVDNEGFLKLPIIGEYFVKGYTETQLENILADKYSSLYVDPYVIVKVVNRRVFVFKGSYSVVVPLNEAPTTLLEVIARAGGIPDDFKAYSIKIIRGDMKNPEVMLVDLSTLDGLRKSNLIVQSNDIVYIERRPNLAGTVLRDLGPYLSFATTITTFIILITKFGK
ncbi:MAG: polysaccharide biosynthesis/export family protein [Chitinophagales bacterium]